MESEYILMEEAKGVQLGEGWKDMELRQQVTIVKDLVAMQKKLQSVTFSRFDCHSTTHTRENSADSPH